jgi:NAD(P)H dehydrogenase (quinone)
MSAAKVYIVYYSMYGHVAKLAHAMVKEARRVPDVDVKLYQVKETLSDDILRLLKAPPADKKVPVIDPMELADADGILLGHPTSFSMVPAQIKAMMDATGRLWVKNMLRDKLIGTFYSTNSQHGGQETTIISMLHFTA